MHVGERAAVARQAQPGAEPLHGLQGVQEFANGIGEKPYSKCSEIRPSRWSPEINSRRSGWNRQTCEGAWPGVSYIIHAPRSVSPSPPPRGRGRVHDVPRSPDSSGPARPRNGAAAPRGLRSGARPPAVGRSPRRVLDPAEHELVAGVHPQLTSRRVRRSRPPGHSGRSGHGCRRAAARPRSAACTCPVHVRAVRSSPLVDAGVHQHEPVSGRRAHALQWGTPGPRQRQAQAIDARKHPFAPSSSRSRGSLARGGD